MSPDPTGSSSPSATASAPGTGGQLLLIRDVFTPADCSDLVRLFEIDGGTASGMPGRDGTPAVVDRRYKARRDLTISGSALSGALRDRVVERVLPPVAQVFGFRATGFEAFKLARYDEGSGWFRPHRDNDEPASAHRRVALTVNLDTGAYEGGGLAFPELGREPVDPPLGSALAFDAALLHEVRPVTRGSRHVLLTFLW
jgi:predicted 2-oxoglutarate/Fe(II)-dependent dioxygenase YbiX